MVERGEDGIFHCCEEGCSYANRIPSGLQQHWSRCKERQQGGENEQGSTEVEELLSDREEQETVLATGLGRDARAGSSVVKEEAEILEQSEGRLSIEEIQERRRRSTREE